MVPELSTRDLLLREARECFANQGFEGTSLNDIAAGVGIRRPSLLHYFPNKEAIYREVIEQALADWGLRIEEALGNELNGWDLVDWVLEASFEFFRLNPAVVTIVRREALSDDGRLGYNLGSALRPFFLRSVAFFEREMEAGTFKRQDAEQLVITGYGALLTYFSDHTMVLGLLDRDPFSVESLEARFHHLKAFIRSALEP